MTPKTQQLSKPFALLLVFVTFFSLFLGHLWIPKDATHQELLANLSKSFEYFNGWKSVGSWPWWTPYSNMGQSMADYLGTIVTYTFLYLGNLIFGMGNTLSLGARIVSLLIIPASAFAMYFFVRELTKNSWTSLAAALLYITFPQLHLRLAYSEHLVVAFCFPYPPLILWALLKLARESQRTWLYSCILAISYAAMSLSYLRSAAVFLPVIICFAAWLCFQSGTSVPKFFKGIILAFIWFVFLAVLPNLPFFREQKWMVLFSQSPLEGWQMTFSMKSSLAWLDRNSGIFSLAAPYFNRDIGGFYIGIVSALVCSILFLVPGKSEQWLSTNEGKLFRLFFGIYLILQWMSYGTHSVISGHLNLLRGAQDLPNWSVPLSWFLLALQCYMIYRLWPKHRHVMVAVIPAIIAYLFLKPFWILERIPLFNQIRAPWVFWEVGGTFTLAIAVGIGILILLNEIAFTPRKVICALLLFIIMLWDMSPYFKKYGQGDLPSKTIDDFLSVEKFLLDSQKPGTVSFESGRYFYLMTPHLSGRALIGEAFHSHFKPTWTSFLTGIPMSSAELFRARFNVCGIAYVVLDKHDPDLPQAMQDYYRSIYPVVLENDHFAVLENPETMTPAFFGREYIATSNGSEKYLSQMLTYLRFNYISVEMAAVDTHDPFLAGAEMLNGGIQLNDSFKNKNGIPFMLYSEPWHRKSYQAFDFNNVPPSGGWLVVPESFHPDWKVFGDGKPLSTYKAMVGLLAVRIPPQTSSVSFRFEPPAWYNACLWISLGAWAGISCLILISPWFGRKEIQESELPQALSPTVLKNILVITPTFKESENIASHMNSVLESDPRVHILVIDDSSPDGTAELVKRHPAFESKVFLLERKNERGYSSACRAGFIQAIERDYDAIITMDADHSHSYHDMPDLIQALEEGHDMAVGSRYLGGIRIHNWPFRRLALSMLAGVYVRAMTQLPLTDPTSGYKAIRKNALKALDWKNFKSEGYAFNIETQYYTWKKGFSIVEVPITFIERVGGKSKMTFRIMLEAALRVAKLLFTSTK